MSLEELLYLLAKENITKQQLDGSFIGGVNGPYNDKETPVRNTAHWLVLLCKVLKNRKDNALEAAAHKAVDYLLSSNARPMQAAFFCRTNRKKDSTNGLIGQAWAMEGLIAAFNTCLLYTSPSPRDRTRSRMPSSA